MACLDCELQEDTFQVSADLWKKVTGLSPDGGALCIRCFEKRAWKNGIYLRNWRTVQAIGDPDKEESYETLQTKGEK